MVERLPKVILDKSITYHCRKGLRWCDCSYCQFKYRASYDMAYTTKYNERDIKRPIIRERLEELKQAI